MEHIVAMRHRRRKPRCVFVTLVDRIDRGMSAVSDKGIVTVDIEPHESLADIDFRPLIGLYVQVYDATETPDRHRRLAALIAKANPARMVMPMQTEAGWVVHYRTAGDPPKTETQRLS